MARSTLRAAAGAGTVAAFLVVGGAAVPVASADPGHSHDGNNAQRGGDSRDRDGRRGHRDGRRDDDGGWQRSGGPIGPDRTAGPIRTNDASSLEPSGGTAVVSELNPDRTQVASRTGTTSRPEVVTDASVSESQTPGTVRRIDGPVTRATLTPTPAIPARPVSGGGGSGAAAVAAPPVAAPPVTVGNGRSPGILTGRREDVVGEAPADVAPPAEAPPAVTPQLAPLYRLAAAPAERTVESLWAAAAPGWPDGLLFGVAGLIFAPIAGGWLGYRQARASRAAAQLVRH
ncbi:MAG: hypothetical protein JWP55_5171 [Mycobacterium sp.]|nr:hypothetical protein [Mycobacterium sp.]